MKHRSDLPIQYLHLPAPPAHDAIASREHRLTRYPKGAHFALLQTPAFATSRINRLVNPGTVPQTDAQLSPTSSKLLQGNAQFFTRKLFCFITPCVASHAGSRRVATGSFGGVASGKTKWTKPREKLRVAPTYRRANVFN